MFIDSHAHLFASEFADDLEEVLRRAASVGVDSIVVPATDIDTSKQAIRLAEKYPSVYACVGYHPHEASKAEATLLEEIERLSEHPKVVAIGEIGLDYFYDFAPRNRQHDIFKAQVEMAIRRNLPIVVHTRDSIPDSIRIVREAAAANPQWREHLRNAKGHLPAPRGVFHCFAGSAEEAKELFRFGFYVSYPGIVTFKKSNAVSTLQQTGFDHILIETDSPYVAPVPLRGKRNEPANVKIVAERIAEVFGVPVEDIARTTAFNTKRLFQIPPSDAPRITYTLRNSLYLNITTRCNADCWFCDRKGDAVVKGYNLALEREPTVEEVIQAIGDPRRYDEIVFCGYGEPTIRWEEVKAIAGWVKQRGVRVRLNTDGHGNIIQKKNIVPELLGLIDEVSISLNSSDPNQYATMMNIPSEPYFGAMVEFAKACIQSGVATTMTVVNLPEVDNEKAKQFTEQVIGAQFRARPYF